MSQPPLPPDEFAKRFFDLWQESTSEMMSSPTTGQKMLDLFTQANLPWSQQHTAPEHDTPSAAAPHTTENHQPGGRPIDELARRMEHQLKQRLEQCERRLDLLEKQHKG